MENAGIPVRGWETRSLCGGDPYTIAISLNEKRRHLTKQERADAIVKMLEARAASKPAQVEDVSKGGRGRVNELKAEAVALGQMQTPPISQSTIERSLAKSRPRPKAKPTGATATPKPKRITIDAGLDAARSHYAAEFARLPASEHDAEIDLLTETLRKAIKTPERQQHG